MEDKLKDTDIEPLYLLLASTAVEMGSAFRRTLRKDILGREDLILTEAVWYLLYYINFYATTTTSGVLAARICESIAVRIASDIGYRETKHAQAFMRLAQHRLKQYAHIHVEIEKGGGAQDDEESQMKLPKLFCGNLSFVLIHARFSEDALPISGNPENEAQFFALYTEYIQPIEGHFRVQLLDLLSHISLSVDAQ